MKIAVMGYGTIGSGVVENIMTNAKELEQRCGEALEVAKVLDLRDFPGTPIENKLVRDYMDIVNDPEIGAVVETMGGVEPAFTFVKAMLEAGKHVATSNKALVAAKGAELIATAKAHNVNFFFEASVGGGIPVIRPLRTCYTADVVEEITGILNGTTNYMLTKMRDEGSEFADVLKVAQDLGYAERNPEADVEGHDACRKIAILTSCITGKFVDFEDIQTEGITSISATDIRYAKAMNRAIKLFASSKKSGETYVCRVSPMLVPVDHPLYAVNDVFNAIYIKGNMVGPTMLYGSGAGKLPTASAVVADLVEATINKDRNIPIDWDPNKLVLGDPSKETKQFFVRTTASKADVEATFGEVSYVEEVEANELGFVTAAMSEADFADKAKKIAVVNRIRLA